MSLFLPMLLATITSFRLKGMHTNEDAQRTQHVLCLINTECTRSGAKA